MELFNLSDKMEYFDMVVDWLFNEWGIQGKTNNKNYWESWVRSSLSKTDIPQTYIGLINEELIGTFSLWRCDLNSRQDIFPWFGGLVISEKHRKKGYGIFLQRKAISLLREMNYSEVHLFTSIENYYEKVGWRFISLIPDEKGSLVRLYKYDLT